MKINADITSMDLNGGRMTVEHQDQTALFSFSTFKKEDFGNNNEVFKHLNIFWSQQSQSFQTAVFACYKRCEDLFGDVISLDELTARLKEQIKLLYDLHPYETMRKWVMNRPELRIPSGFNKTYQHDPDRNTSEDKTYLFEDYRDLMTLTMLLRIMVPLWASYIRHIRSHTGNGLKELQAYRLLGSTYLSALPAMDKMLNYIAANLRKESGSVIPIAFVDEDDQPYWLLTVFCVRKLCVGELELKDDRANLVTLLSNFIRVKTGFPETDASKKTVIKSNDDSGDENRASLMEGVRVNVEFSLQEAEEIPFAVRDPRRLLSIHFPIVPMELLEDALRTSSELLEMSPEYVNRSMPPQRMLTGWVMKHIIPPMGVDFMDLEVLVGCMALTQAVLWSRGYQYLALLSTAYAPRNVSQVHVVSSSPGRARVPEEMQKQLREVFPHVQMIQSRKAAPKEVCKITEDIDLFLQDVSEVTWRATANKSLFEECLGSSITRQIPIQPDLKIQMTQLAIDIGSNRFFQ